MVVRPVRAGEAAALWAVRLRALADAPEAFGQTLDEARASGPASFEELVADAVAGRQFVAVAEARRAERAGELVGMTGVRRSAQEGKFAHRAVVWGVWVAPEARGLGVAGAMLDQAIDWCRASGVGTVQLTVVVGNTAALRLYRRAGFVVYGTDPDAMRDGGRSVPEHLMLLRLDAEPVAVRAVRAGEGPALWALRLRSLAESPDTFGQTVAEAEATGGTPIVRLVAEAVAGHAFAGVAEQGGRLVGMAVVRPGERAANRHRGVLFGVFVAPEARGQGVATRLVEAAVAWCRGRGLRSVELWVRADNTAARAVYERAGFVRRGLDPDRFRTAGAPVAEHLMILSLSHETIPSPPQDRGDERSKQ
ncbi:MAG TPA: GNAT family N-acetyltransferase [Actinomycetota bacterium]|nr:GNAT family N-acetyltransferase [Actinomycetota bacterium]